MYICNRPGDSLCQFVCISRLCSWASRCL